MRWPLRNQILLPMTAVLVAALAGVSAVNAMLLVRRARARVERQLADVVSPLERSTFPLTDRVLEQVRGLSGAEYVVYGMDGRRAAASSPEAASWPLREHRAAPRDDSAGSGLAEVVTVGGRRYFHMVAVLHRPRDGGPLRLHMLYPVASYEQAWRDVVLPSLWVGAVAVALAIAASAALAFRATQPLRRLERQVEDIARGEFRSIAVPRHDDEIADLTRSVNRMAEMLTQYESQVRRHERMNTLGQLGGGMAHQLRNAVTGCRMAIDLHRKDCHDDPQSLDMAMRQLRLMERYLQRFLSLGRGEARPHTAVHLPTVLSEVISLMEPTARHAGVAVRVDIADRALALKGDADAIGQVLVNILLNAVSAASRVPSERAAANHGACVRVTLGRRAGCAVFEIADTGPGPAAHVAERIFEPFVSEKIDGTGLGLTVAREVIAAHRGTIRWHRCDGQTVFEIELPLDEPHLTTEGQHCVQTARG